METAEQSLQHLYKNHAQSKSCLSRMELMLRYLGDPHRSFKAIHVAGSNGKGSVCLKIQKALSLSGMRVGLYTSPHLFRFSERIKIGDEEISDKDIVEGLQLLFGMVKKTGFMPTIFEMTTLLCFWYFEKQGIDIAVIETGIGGRLDATRFVVSILTVITSLSLEHTQLLGNTVEQIGKEKAGICKPLVPLILGPAADVDSVREVALELKCPVYVCKEPFEDFDECNQSIARKALNVLSLQGYRLDSVAMEKALEIRPSCRKEKLGSFIFDVAHNPDAFEHLFAFLKRKYPRQSLTAIVGMSSDKDYISCLRLVAIHCSKICLVRAKGDRFVSQWEMKRVLHEMGYANFEVFETIAEAVFAQNHARDTLCVVCGSFYIMEEAYYAVQSILKA